jgi:hypothetical protein
MNDDFDALDAVLESAPLSDKSDNTTNRKTPSNDAGSGVRQAIRTPPGQRPSSPSRRTSSAAFGVTFAALALPVRSDLPLLSTSR